MPTRRIMPRFQTLIVGLNDAANWLADQPCESRKTTTERSELEDLRCLAEKMAKAIDWYLAGSLELEPVTDGRKRKFKPGTCPLCNAKLTGEA